MSCHSPLTNDGFKFDLTLSFQNNNQENREAMRKTQSPHDITETTDATKKKTRVTRESALRAIKEAKKTKHEVLQQFELYYQKNDSL